MKTFSRRTMIWVCGIGALTSMLDVAFALWDHHALVAGLWALNSVGLGAAWFARWADPETP
jgi:hypothetical protein